ncbi:DUF3240 family protein [Roseateles aquatilis]|nr:DUF3240 family protein [Roseateles aquatilis]
MVKLCLSLICSPSSEEQVLDELLQIQGDNLFTSSMAFSHGLAPTRMAASEQVLGRSASAVVQVIVEESAMPPLITHLAHAFKGTGIRYWVTVVVMDGEM